MRPLREEIEVSYAREQSNNLKPENGCVQKPDFQVSKYRLCEWRTQLQKKKRQEILPLFAKKEC